MNEATTDASLKAYYATRAPYYDAVYAKPERREDIAFLQAHIPARLAQRRVLEVACGTAFWTPFIAPAAASVIATDILPEPLAFARMRPGLESVRFVETDAYALPESLGMFDGAFSGLWLSHIPIRRRTEFLDSLHRRLQPGARVILIDNSDVQCREFPIVERDADGNTFQQRPLRDGSTHRVLKNFPERSELEAMISDYGTAPVYRAFANFWYFEYESSG